jgi:ankyrin repeat protein
MITTMPRSQIVNPNLSLLINIIYHLYQYHNTCLLRAITANHKSTVPMVKLLLDRGANIHAYDEASICLSVCLSVYLSLSYCVFVSKYLYIYIPIYQSIYPSIYLSVNLSIYLSVNLSVIVSVMDIRLLGIALLCSFLLTE